MNVLQELRNDIEGAKLLKDWLGPDAETVGVTQAELRSGACTHGYANLPCPKNVAPNWWDLVAQAKNAIAETIRAELELKGHLNLHVLRENDLHMCSICGCCMTLKVWTPIEHIKAHTTPEQLAQYPIWCWIRQELSEKV